MITTAIVLALLTLLVATDDPEPQDKDDRAAEVASPSPLSIASHLLPCRA